jgi:DNA mismatch repair protein MutS2
MNQKSAETLEFPKVLQRLAKHTTFSTSRTLATTLEPVADLHGARVLQRETSEARELLEKRAGITLGGVSDVRDAVLTTTRGVVLDGSTLLDIKSTLRRASIFRRTLTGLAGQYPLLAELADQLEECEGIQEEIERVLDDNAEVKDTASARLAVIRRDIRVAFDRLQTKINNIASSSSNAKYLQEQHVTQRNGRYVIPLKAEFKGRIPGVVHDQSSSGATIFIEPLSTVELNNRYRELQIEEENEVRRVLAALCETIGYEAERIVRTVEGLAYLDLVLARARYADELDALEPRLVDFQPHHGDELNYPGGNITLIQARHPLLDPKSVVAIDVELDENTYALVITGPNTGGKTVALKTIGLMVLMSQYGMHLPTGEGTVLSIFEDIYADIGDEQSIEQSLSTFSSHMTNIIRILDIATPRSLVILDELGAGTDPAEGSALARALLTHFLERGVTTLITTHHPELKAFSYNRAGIRNASVQFDVETLAPTYRLIMGLPGRSNALAIATRLGLPEDIISAARAMVGTEDLKVDNLLDEIQQSRDEAEQALQRARQRELEINDVRNALQARLDAIEQERMQKLRDAEEKGDAELEILRRDMRRLRQQLEAVGQPVDAIKDMQRNAAEMRASDYVNIPEPEPEEPYNDTTHKFRLGEMVYVPSLSSEGQITEITEDDFEVMVGRLRVRTKLDEIEPLSRKQRKQAEAKHEQRTRQREVVTPERSQSPGLELDLRGQRVEAAVARVEDYIDAAYMSALPFVRIIHGKGTGALRSAVRDVLSQHPLVAKHAPGGEKEGGSGVTIVHLAPQA